jgi:hypothetical protein
MKRVIVTGAAALASVVCFGLAAQSQTPKQVKTYPQGQTMPWGQTSDRVRRA